ncbi:DNA-binding response regulator [Actinomyces sp. Z5]|uniref:response regulator n=1 Tax=Actinomyces sp. Z5 TaxID=2250216 RepID=UPI000DCB7398|nr:response regulator transcription factor [Actinomyces sp. Z5]RAX19381.1 DNA-binding response regulator [Actinomyces sp. Z5]
MSEVTPPLRIMIVDDDPLIRTVFAEQIDAQPPVTVVTTAENGMAALDLLSRGNLEIDVALVDIDMPGLSGPHTARAIIQNHPGIAVVMFTVFRREDSLRDALAEGVSGFITKDEPPEAVAHALVRAARGEPVMSSRPTELLVEAYRVQQDRSDAVRQAQAAVEKLPPHLQEVHACLLKGLTNKRIATRLNLSQNTVRLYVSDVLHELGYNSRTELMAAYITG